MRGTVAKRLRRLAYGDISLRQPRRYRRNHRGDIVNYGERALYQQLKKNYKENKNDPG